MPAIKIENLSKRYIIGHQKRERYTALRDVMMHKVRGIGQRLRHPLSPNREVVDVEEFWALRDIDLEIQQGDRVGIIGRNGAGKSTLLKILSRITEPTKGRIAINGRVASLLEVGTGFHPELSGRENIFLNGAILGMSRAEIKRKFDEIVDFSGTEKFLDTPVKRYSSGMYVRLAFAVAAHLESEILIVDEVLAVGDAQFQKRCLGRMSEVADSGRTVLFVSHNMGAIRNLCDRSVLLKGGKLLDAGATESIISKYVHEFQEETVSEVTFDYRDAGFYAFPVKLKFFGKDGRGTAQFHIGEPWRIQLNFEVAKRISSVIAAIGVETAEGVPIMSSWSSPEELDPGEYSVQFEIDHRFSVNDFSILIGISSLGSNLFYKEHCATISVIEVTNDEQPLKTAHCGLLLSGKASKIKRTA